MLRDVAPPAVADPYERGQLAYLLAWSRLRADERAEQLQNFARALSLWTTAGREREQPYFGWLSTDLPLYQPSTLSLKARVRTQPALAVASVSGTMQPSSAARAPWSGR